MNRKDAYLGACDLMRVLSTDSRVAALKANDELESAKSARDCIRQLQGQCKSWVSGNFEKNKKEADDAIEAFRSSFTALKDVVEQMELMRAQNREGECRENRNVRNRKKKISDVMHKSGKFPHALAMSIAESVYVSDEMKKRHELYVSRNSLQEMMELNSTDLDFDRPRSMMATNAESYLHIATQDWLKNNAKTLDLDKKMQKGYASIIKNDDSHVICLLKDAPLAISGATSHDAQPRFQQDKQLQPFLFAFQSFAYQLNVAQNPYAGLAQVYIVYAGYVIVKFVRIADILSAGDNLTTMSTFLEKQSHACFERHGTLVVGAGSSFYVPFGYVALYTAIPSKDNDEAFEKCHDHQPRNSG